MDKIKDSKFIAILSYLWFLSLIPLLISEDKFVKFHSKQGTRLCIVYTPILIILICLNKIEKLFKITDILIGILSIMIILLSLTGIYDVIKVNTKPLPLINKLFRRRMYEKNK